MPSDDKPSIPQVQSSDLRIIDANANRAAEGLRVIEDFARFHLNDRFLSQSCKQLRHDLNSALETIGPVESRLAMRETQRDVGSQVSTQSEFERTGSKSIVAASFSRAQQAIRCLEEYSKLIHRSAAEQFESIRYQLYTLEKAVAATYTSHERLAIASIYVLVDCGKSWEDYCERVDRTLAANVDVIQLRDKTQSDDRLKEYAAYLREKATESETIFVVNDRPDIAVISQADGVHLGQDDLSVFDARKIVGPDILIGRSTHSLEQAQAAVLDGADYIGVGPTFPSNTKSFDDFTGVQLLRQVSESISLPAFAIGGISPENVDQVAAAGFQRVAVSNCIWNAATAVNAADELRRTLNNLEETTK